MFSFVRGRLHILQFVFPNMMVPIGNAKGHALFDQHLEQILTTSSFFFFS
jgi:hypothetical protein